MTRPIKAMDRYELARLANWYDRAMTLVGTRAVGRYVRRVERGGLDDLQDALYWLGQLRHHTAAADHLKVDPERERASLARRLDDAERTHRIAGSDETAKRLADMRSAMAEWDARRSWHLTQAESAAKECAAAASIHVEIRSTSDAREIATDLADSIQDLNVHDIEQLADYLQAVEAVFEFSGALEWTQAVSMATAAKSYLSTTETHAEHQTFLRHLEGRAGHRGVMLGGSVGQERKRRTQGAG